MRRVLGEGLPPVLLDKIQIHQVITNLIRNSVDALDGVKRREIVISTRRAGHDSVEIAVADTGPGLAPEVADRLFQPFVTTKPAGLGIGLSICRSIVDAHGGRLWASDNPGGGVVFHVQPAGRSGERRARCLTRPGSSSSTMTRRSWIRCGCCWRRKASTVETFERASAFLQRFEGKLAGCLVTDVRMPEMDGLELLQALAARGPLPPVIVITGHGEVPLAVQAMKLGARDFIEKPFDPAELIDEHPRRADRGTAPAAVVTDAGDRSAPGEC